MSTYDAWVFLREAVAPHQVAIGALCLGAAMVSIVWAVKTARAR